MYSDGALQHLGAGMGDSHFLNHGNTGWLAISRIDVSFKGSKEVLNLCSCFSISLVFCNEDRQETSPLAKNLGWH